MLCVHKALIRPLDILFPGSLGFLRGAPKYAVSARGGAPGSRYPNSTAEPGLEDWGICLQVMPDKSQGITGEDQEPKESAQLGSRPGRKRRTAGVTRSAWASMTVKS